MTNSGVAHFQSGSSLRFPCLRLQHQKSRSLARPKVRKSEERVISEKNKAIDPRIVWCGHFKALSFQIPDGWTGNRVRRRFPHWLQQVAPRVPAEILEAPRNCPRTFLQSRSWTGSRSSPDLNWTPRHTGLCNRTKPLCTMYMCLKRSLRAIVIYVQKFCSNNHSLWQRFSFQMKFCERFLWWKG